MPSKTSSSPRSKWMPTDPSAVQTWLANLVQEASRDPQPLHPVIERFQSFIENDPHAYMLFSEMFEQIPVGGSFDQDPSGEQQIRDYKVLLRVLNAIVNRSPEFNSSGVVGVPINAILDRPMATVAGFTAFLDPRINAHLKSVLDEWARFLSSPDSTYVLNEDAESGWLGKNAMKAMPKFVETFECDPSMPHWGFTSWDDFFTRAHREGVRPVAEPDNDKVIVNACESAPYRIATSVKARDRFWIKGQNYSVDHMLAGDELAAKFAGGTVYQAFLSALSYHRWHAPVGGVVVRAYVVPGTYYSETLAEREEPEALIQSQAYTTAVATRALIFIEADDPSLGLVCFMGIGMSEVSTCAIGVYEGQHVAKGQEIGMFHYGGSTYCVLFGPDVRLNFDLHGQEPSHEASNIPVCARLASVI